MEDTRSESEGLNNDGINFEYNLKHELIKYFQNPKNLFKTNSILKDFLYLNKCHERSVKHEILFNALLTI